MENNRVKKTDKGNSRLKSAMTALVPMVLAACLLVAASWGKKQQRRADELELAVESGAREAYSELGGAVYDLHIALSKLLVSEAPGTLTLALEDIHRHSADITALMGRIPQPHPENIALTRLLAQTGDYSRRLSSAVLGAKPISASDREQLTALYTASGELASRLFERLANGDIPLRPLNGSEFFASPAENAGEEWPKLVYDGPMSDSAEQRVPLALSGEKLDENAAKAKAEEFLKMIMELNGEEGETPPLEPDGEDTGRMANYGFTCELANGESAELSVTAQNGELLYFRIFGQNTAGNGETPDDEELEALKSSAEAFLSKLYEADFEPTFAHYYDDSVLLEFALTVPFGGEGELPEKVLLYPDTVRLRVSRDGGAVIGADASVYLMNHTERTLPTEGLTADEAAEGLSPYFEAREARLALIPLDDLTERLCWEFRGGFSGGEYYIYLDYETGDEVRISRIVTDESGSSAL